MRKKGVKLDERDSINQKCSWENWLAANSFSKHSMASSILRATSNQSRCVSEQPGFLTHEEYNIVYSCAPIKYYT